MIRLISRVSTLEAEASSHVSEAVIFTASRGPRPIHIKKQFGPAPPGVIQAGQPWKCPVSRANRLARRKPVDPPIDLLPPVIGLSGGIPVEWLDTSLSQGTRRSKGRIEPHRQSGATIFARVFEPSRPPQAYPNSMPNCHKKSKLFARDSRAK